MRLSFLAIASFLVVGGCTAATTEIPDCSGDTCDIHGTDDRFEASALETPELALSGRAVGALFREGALADQGDGTLVVADSRTYGDKLELCPDVRFSQQVSGASCSGFLISSDIFVTAGHCISALPCASTQIVFDFARTEDGEEPVIRKENVYKCESVLFNPYQDGLNRAADIAILKLTRPVQDREPMNIAESSPSIGDSVLALGFPRGLPLKVSPASVQRGAHTDAWAEHKEVLARYIAEAGWGEYFEKIGKEGLFHVDVDVFGGNSGGALVDATTGAVSGVVVREGFKAIIGEGGVESLAAQELDFLEGEGELCRRPSVCGESVECLNYPSVVPLADYALELQAAIEGVLVLDKDQDGLTDLAEEAQGLDPSKTDSDGDFLSDGEEVGDIKAPLDSDGDGTIDALDDDSDGDGVSDSEESGDEDLTTAALDTDYDGVPDYLDLDSDGDGFEDANDNCRLVFSANNSDLDGDGQGDACDGDVDGDEVPDEADICVAVADPEQEDLDTDGLGDACDGDIDGDGVSNGNDNCVETANARQDDTDQDSVGDACDDEDTADEDTADEDTTDEDTTDEEEECTEAGTCDEGEAGAGCSVASGSTTPWWPLLLAMFLIRRRRRLS